MKEDDKMAESLDGSNWDGPGGSGGQNGQNGDGAPEAQSLPVRVGRLEGEFKHLATKADLEKGLSKLGTELGEKIAAVDKGQAEVGAKVGVLIWVIGAVGGGILGVLLLLALRLPQ